MAPARCAASSLPRAYTPGLAFHTSPDYTPALGLHASPAAFPPALTLSQSRPTRLQMPRERPCCRLAPVSRRASRLRTLLEVLGTGHPSRLLGCSAGQSSGRMVYTAPPMAGTSPASSSRLVALCFLMSPLNAIRTVLPQGLLCGDPS